MKKTRSVIAIIVAVILVAAAVAALIIFREEIADFFTDVRERLSAKKEEFLAKDEFDDYADV